jgi:hypothetical protein
MTTEFLTPETRALAAVDSILPAPVVDALAAHSEVAGAVGDLPSRGDQVERPAPELRWVASCDADLLTRSWA